MKNCQNTNKDRKAKIKDKNKGSKSTEKKTKNSEYTNMKKASVKTKM